MNVGKLIQQTLRWSGLPLVRVGPLLRPDDGDMALLDELAERVFTALDRLPDGERLAATIGVICRHEMLAVTR
ncbi:hypothetical protein [Mycobacterium botniense]|uniref:Uncharacterized protein n=1 Tax=Mycobacterium botniense TaxID=84962 RepID=A0A7I9XSH0_9MYCO|nr:hypothetical protein [Mycobacterium botniense]GFG72718.1 hypothetical protein MBOT_00830 [Mycobacterium botniense]